MTEILIEKGNLTEYDVDAIVNAANNDLILGGALPVLLLAQADRKFRRSATDKDR